MNKNPVSMVEELGMKTQVRPEWEIRDVTQKLGTPQFQCHLKFNYQGKDYYAMGQASKKKDAKALAASNMLTKEIQYCVEAPRVDDIPQSINTHTTDGVGTAVMDDIDISDTPAPIPKLNIVCSTYRTSSPEFIEGNSEGMSHAPTFTVTCTVRSATGQEFVVTAKSSRKKHAKNMAAYIMMKRLENELDSKYAVGPDQVSVVKRVFQLESTYTNETVMWSPVKHHYQVNEANKVSLAFGKIVLGETLGKLFAFDICEDSGKETQNVNVEKIIKEHGGPCSFLNKICQEQNFKVSCFFSWPWTNKSCVAEDGTQKYVETCCINVTWPELTEVIRYRPSFFGFADTKLIARDNAARKAISYILGMVNCTRTD